MITTAPPPATPPHSLPGSTLLQHGSSPLTSNDTKGETSTTTTRMAIRPSYPQSQPLDAGRLASPTILAELLPHRSKARSPPNNARPSLYHDAEAEPSGSSSSSLRPLYTRHFPSLPSPNILHFVPASLREGSQHLHLFTTWQSTPRVAEGWDQAWSESRQRAYLSSVQEKDDQLGLIGYWSDSEEELGMPWGYVEVYWAAESNLAEHYEWPEHAMGFHALVGEEKARGPHRVHAWMPSVVEMIRQLEPRCTLVCSEPKATNSKMIRYECETGGRVEREVQLPHKRAALVLWERGVQGGAEGGGEGGGSVVVTVEVSQQVAP